MTVLTGVSSHICAAHRDRDGKLHGHTWEVVAWFEEGQDALALQRKLQAALIDLDHESLPDNMRSGEAIARWIGRTLDCEQVDVSRPLERIYARWTA